MSLSREQLQEIATRICGEHVQTLRSTNLYSETGEIEFTAVHPYPTPFRGLAFSVDPDFVATFKAVCDKMRGENFPNVQVHQLLSKSGFFVGESWTFQVAPTSSKEER